MTFPQGIDFRDTAGYVTDPTNYTYQAGPLSTANYPVTTPQGNTVGWETLQGVTVSAVDRNSSLDPRLAGINFLANTAAHYLTYRIDLPAAGSYGINLALGDTVAQTGQTAELFDGTTSLGFIVQNAATGASEWYDATGILRTSAADWVSNNAALTATFATTILRLKLGANASGYTTLATLYVAASGGGGTTLTLTAAILNVKANAPGAVFHSALTAKGAAWVPNAPSLAVKMQLPSKAQSWNAFGVGASVALALTAKAQGWVANALAASSVIALASRGQAWIGNAFSALVPTTLVLATAAWNYIGIGIVHLGSVGAGILRGVGFGTLRGVLRGVIRGPASRK